MIPSNLDLHASSYDYHLPEHLIADRPIEGRHHSKLLVYDVKSGEVTHAKFLDIANYLPEDSLLVLNQSKVFPCRILGQKKSGGQCEIFFLTISADENSSYECLIKARGTKKLGDEFYLPEEISVKIVKINEGSFQVSVSCENLEEYLSRNALLPIPPYIRNGQADEKDKTDYQTVYASNKKIGSVAAPTAGLHFTQEIFKSLAEKKIERAFVTLHVGMGTFAPVKAEHIHEHKMHFENYHVEKSEYEKIKNAKSIFAVGTTSLRVLESVARIENEFESDKTYNTNIFLYPGQEVKSISGLITNFHLPKSTLLMLVSSLVGREKALELYQIAIKNEYRFFSYGDAMLILR